MTKKDTFDEKHGELMKFFFELYISNKEFSSKWKIEFRLALLMEGRKIDVEYISEKTQNAFKSLKISFNACLDAIEKNNKIIKPKSKKMYFVFRSLLVELLNHLAKSFDQNLPFLQPHQVLWINRLTIYQEYRKYIFSDKQVFEVLVFLSNFSLDAENGTGMKLLKNVKIARNMDYFFERDEFPELKKDTALVFEFETEKFGNVGNWNTEDTINGFQYPHEEMKEDLYAILTAFRLLKKGDVGVFAIKCTTPSPFSKPFDIRPDLDFLFQFKAGQYQFQKSDLNPFRTLYKKIKDKPNCKELDMCISRFNKSYTRTSIADVIIDLVVAMEAITSETKDSLSYKIKTQLARLIETDKTKRKELAGKIGDIYAIRSQLVHGGKINKKKIKNKQFANTRTLLEESRTVLRNAITRLLRLMKIKTYEEIFENIIYG